MTDRIEAEEQERRDLETLLDEIGSGAIDERSDLEDAQIDLLRRHLTEEELIKLFDRAAGPEDE